MISLPDAIVIYPEKIQVPEYLLCWVPAREFGRVAANTAARENLEKLTPRGIEVELSTDGLEQHGLDLGTPPDALRQAYLDLHDENLLPEDGMVTLDALDAYLETRQDRSKEAVTAELMGAPGTLAGPGENPLLDKLLSPPPMTAGQHPGQVYRRLNPEQVPPDAQSKGGRDAR
jgi:hypothetical protein